jgi:hypothetical protein
MPAHGEISGPREVARLRLPAPPQDGRPAHVTAASGLVRVGGVLYVVSDDDYLLTAFADPAEPGSPARLAPDTLPADKDQRKSAKPDIESLARLPGALGAGTDALLALGSGSTPSRDRGWLLPAGGGGPREASTAALYGALRRELDGLNIEGAAECGGRMWLAQRGNGAGGHPALVELDARPVRQALVRGEEIDAAALLSVRAVEIGEAGGVGLTLSDLEPLADGRLLFCAVAEAGASTYHDGECVGSALGVLDPARGEVALLVHLPEPRKIEGAAVTAAVAGAIELLLVEDPDDETVPAPLLQARLRGGAALDS